MTLLLTFAILAVTIIYFCLDKAGRIRKNGIGSCLFYIAVPMLSALMICISVMITAGGMGSIFNALTESMDTMNSLADEEVLKAGLSSAVGVIIQFLASVPAIIIAAAGCIGFIQREKNESTMLFGSDGVYEARKFLKLGAFSAGAAIISGIAAIVFGVCVAAYASGAISMGLIQLVLICFFLTMLTFGVGLILVVFIFPILAASLGIGVIINCLPLIISAFAWGCAFCILHVFTVFFAVFGLKKLYSEGALEKKKAMVLGIVSAIPVVNIFVMTYIFSLIKVDAA